jgi:hypothetical protein
MAGSSIREIKNGGVGLKKSIVAIVLAAIMALIPASAALATTGQNGYYWTGSGQFEVYVGDANVGKVSYNWTKFASYTLSTAVEQQGTINGHTLKLVVPKDTKVTSDILAVYMWTDGSLHFEPSLAVVTLSQNATVFEQVKGEWVQKANFATISGGLAK